MPRPPARKPGQSGLSCNTRVHESVLFRVPLKNITRRTVPFAETQEGRAAWPQKLCIPAGTQGASRPPRG